MSSAPTFYTNAFLKGNHIYVRGIEQGRRVHRQVAYTPTLFVADKTANSEWVSIQGAPLRKLTFNSIYDAKDYEKQYKGVSGIQLFGMPRYVYTYLHEHYTSPVDYDASLIRTVFLDIEVSAEFGFPRVEEAAHPIIAITARDHTGYHIFGLRPFQYDDAMQPIQYTLCQDEEDLLRKFMAFWSGGSTDGYPDVVTGWNTGTFDIPYLAKRLANIDPLLAEKLSPWGIVNERQGFDKLGKETSYIEIAGVAHLDYLDLYRKFTYSQQESYKLGHIAHVELGEQKKNYQDYETLHTLYTKNHQLFMEYNVHDVYLLVQLDAKMKLLDLAFALAYDAKVNYEDVFMQVRMWDVLVHNYLWDRGVAVPIDGDGHKSEAYVGAYVKEPHVGRHNWVVSFDVASMYPNLIRMFNISPETIMNEMHRGVTVDNILAGNIPTPRKGTCIAANGWVFRTDVRGFLPEMMERISKDRNQAKKNMQAAQQKKEAAQGPEVVRQLDQEISKWKNMQLALKVKLNACYGALGNQHFRHFNIHMATAITLGGQLVIRWAEKEINAFMNAAMKTENVDYVIASDTDSLYLNMGTVVNKLRLQYKDKVLSDAEIIDYLDRLSEKKIVPEFERMFADLAGKLGAQKDAMVMKREAIASAAIWTAKKRYILYVHDNEGVRYAEPKLKMMGIEAVKSSTPMHCRKAIIEAIKLIVTATEADVQDFIDSYRVKFKTLPFEEIAFPRSVQGLAKYAHSSKSVPIHVKGALTYNALLKAYKLEQRFDTIKEGEKIKFCYLKEPNPVQSHVITAISVLPTEFGLQPYIDYDLQFEKAFLEPLRIILGVVGWREEAVNTLEDFFS